MGFCSKVFVDQDKTETSGFTTQPFPGQYLWTKIDCFISIIGEGIVLMFALNDMQPESSCLSDAG